MAKNVSRRDFLRAGLGLAGVSLLAACGPSAPSTPAKPAVEPTKPAAAPAATAAPAAKTDAKPADKPAADAKPAAPAPAKPDAKPGGLGSQYIGQLEGPTVMPDAPRPARLGEAPMLADLVKAGKLPAVDQRVPLEPMVVKPLSEVGKYGGTWRRGFTGPADDENGNRFMSTDKLLFWDYTGTKQVPSLAKSVEMRDGGKTFIVQLRKGMKWSDGAPFTADDFVFWYEDLYTNKEIVPTPSADFAVNGKQGRVRKIDETSFAFEFDDPFPLFLTVLGGTTYIGGAMGFSRGFYGGGYFPKHYLRQFLPKYSSEAEVTAKAREARFDDWKAYLKNRTQYALNPDLPVVFPWRTVTPINNPTWVLERNPYYWAVDPDGNQLPYIDKIQMTLAENLEVLNLRAVAGEYDWQERHTTLDKLPVFIENQQKGNYTVRLDPALNGSDATLQINQTFKTDPEVAKWLKNKDFRHALSLGIDRDQLNETFWLGVGQPGNVSPSEDSPYSPGAGSRKKWATLDVRQANEILDKLGLTQKDSEGFRLRSDGRRLRLETYAAAGSFVPLPRIGQEIANHWKRIGIHLDVVELERNEAFNRMRNNEHQMFMWANDGSELIYAFPRHAIPVDPVEPTMGPLWAQWFASGGERGEKPDDEQMLKIFELFNRAKGETTEQSIKTAQEMWNILIEQCYSIGTVGVSPGVMGVRIVKNNMGNVPARQVNAQHCRTPGTSHPATVYFKS